MFWKKVGPIILRFRLSKTNNRRTEQTLWLQPKQSQRVLTSFRPDPFARMLYRKSTKLLTLLAPHCHVRRTDDNEAVNQPPSMHTPSTALAFEFMALYPSLLFTVPTFFFFFTNNIPPFQETNSITPSHNTYIPSELLNIFLGDGTILYIIDYLDQPDP